MFCANCGTKQNEGEKFCPNCGTRFEEPKIVKEEVSVDTSKQTLPKNEEVDLPKVVEEKKTGTVIEEVKISDVVNKEEVNKENAPTPKETIKIGSKEECIKIDIDNSTIEPEVEIFVDNSQLPNKLNDDVTVSEDDADSNVSKNEVIIAKNIVKNGSVNNSTTTPNTITQRAPFIDETDEKSVLKWAIRYELGLGVPVDTDRAEELYAKAGNGTNILKLLSPNDKSKQSGIISDGFNVERIKLYDIVEERKEKYERERAQRKKEQELESARKEQEKIQLQKKIEQEEKIKIQEEEKKRKKEDDERKKIEEIKRLKKDAFKHKSNGFMEFSYIVKYISLDLENLIKEYNAKAEKHGYDRIIIDKELKLIKGQYKEKSITGQGFVKGLSSLWRNSFLEVDFEDILKECAKVRDV